MNIGKMGFLLHLIAAFVNVTVSYAALTSESGEIKIVEITDFPTMGVSNSNGDGYFSSWNCYGEIPLTLSNGYNNMYYSGSNLDLYYGKSHSPYTLSVNGGAYKIMGYDIVFRNSDTSKNTTIVPAKGGAAVTCEGDGEAVLKVSGLDNYQSTTFEISTAGGANVAARMSKLVVYLSCNDTSVVESDNVLFDSKASTYPYRIPALAVTRNGDILAVSDYRPCGSDIGNGDVDIHLRISEDNGFSWGPETKILNGTGSGETAGYGDAAIVADRESDRVRIMCVTGDAKFSESGVVPVNLWNPFGEKKIMRIATTISEDNGRTWTKPVDITDNMYSTVNVKGLFFTSGRIVQSKQIKVGNYYRIYSVLCTHDNIIYDQSKNVNYVCYSDDFGETWKQLGGVAIDGGDEAKCEELPNGNLMVSTRMSGGRKFNIFTYDDQANATGAWASPVVENNKFGDVTSCNGELLIVDAHRTEDNQPVKLLLHSLSRNVNGVDRSYVSIYHKELNAYATPSDLTQGWSDPYVVSEKTSAYSTMMPTHDDKIAFFFEDEVVEGGYQMTYRNLDLRDITGGKYYLGKYLHIDSDDVIELENGEHIGELEIDADAENSGQVIARNGGADVDEVILKYSAVPGVWNFISFPADVNIDNASNLNELGFFYNGEGGNKAYYIKEYSEVKRATNGNEGWESVVEPVVVKGKGYLFGVARNSDNPENLPVEVEFRFRGEDLDNYINEMDANMTSLMSYSEVGEVYNRGWNLLGNPYFSNMNPTLANSFEYRNVAPFVYQYVPETDTYNVFTSGTEEVMAITPFSAFFVQAIAPEPVVLFHNSQNDIPSDAVPGIENNTKKVRIGLLFGEEEKFMDRTDIYMSSNVSDDFVLGEDAIKMWGGMSGVSNELATIAGNKYCAVNGVCDGEKEIPLMLNLHSKGKFIIRILMNDGLVDDDMVVLYDKKEDIAFDLRENAGGYGFEVDDAADVNDRFVIKVYKKAPVGIVDNVDNTFVVKVYKNIININNLQKETKVTVFNISGNVVVDELVSASSWSVALESGLYLLKIDNGENLVTKKVLLSR